MKKQGQDLQVSTFKYIRHQGLALKTTDVGLYNIDPSVSFQSVTTACQLLYTGPLTQPSPPPPPSVRHFVAFL